MGYSDDLRFYKFLKDGPTDKGTMSDGEIERFLSLEAPYHISNRDWEKQTLFFSLLAYTGCRPGEIASLRTSQIYDNQLILTNTKTKRPRNVPIPHPVLEKLNEYLINLETDYLFITTKGKIYSDHFWIPAFRRRLERAGVHRTNVTCYSFRHSMATSLLKQDIAISKISKLLGNTPEQIYKSYDHLVVTDVEKALNKHPLIKKYRTPRSSEILEELENLLKGYNLRFTISKKDGEIDLSVFLR